MFRGIEGYGASSAIHTTRLLSMSEDLPVSVIIVDAAERIRAFLPELDELVTEGLILLDEVEVIRHVGRRPASTSDLATGHRRLPRWGRRCAT